MATRLTLHDRRRLQMLAVLVLVSAVQAHGRVLERDAAYTPEVQAAREAHLAIHAAARLGKTLANQETLAIRTARISFNAAFAKADAAAKHAKWLAAVQDQEETDESVEALLKEAAEAEVVSQLAAEAATEAVRILAEETVAAEERSAVSEAARLEAVAAAAEAKEAAAEAAEVEERAAAAAQAKDGDQALAAEAWRATAARRDADKMARRTAKAATEATNAAHFDAFAVAKLRLGPAQVRPTSAFSH